jgi:hypothetical protein
MMARNIEKLDRDLLQEVVLKRDPDLLLLIENLGMKPLTEAEREQLRAVVADELCATGLREDDEPNQRGLKLEELIDILGSL